MLGVNFYQYTRGWHPTTTIGVFGAAAACAKLRLTDGQTATALSIATSLACGIKSNRRTRNEVAENQDSGLNGRLRTCNFTPLPEAATPA